ncbi:filamentous hemagglutinin N-terminal domain-containing protein [Campylobacter peloridis]|uniref:Filamentous hemagglutinin N-terminal domain-containing protein n=1 Tax=Campylobacter peloridis TaxID=488546 RepID=A0ABX6TTR6_9BACT|nr:filamentous hemagglutinin N-terminal domain-containing protein [Campylobacter peloridis]QOQ89117.1 filamentous hemagglutinin N-terminal domain-containing protein [Campylobacter peloridis]
MLFSPAFALPSGGKFTHGTSGTINVSGNNMHINGNKVNSVIQWGGGFNINKGESVNFGGNSKNYLNIAHGTNKSTIAGVLNASGNNVFLINPNGVIITKTGNINANRFVASTSSMSNEDMNKFANMKTFEQGATFSPVFKPQKAGSVVNMGNINANDVLLIGHKVDIQGGKLGNANSKTHLVGNYVYIDADSANLNSIINVTAKKDGYIQRKMINFANDGYRFGNNVNINKVNYTDNTNVTHNGISSNFKKALTIGNMENEKANAIEWRYLIKGWNEGLGDTRSIDEFKLVGNINFDNKLMDPIGINGAFFNKTLDGQGYTLSNLLIDGNEGGLFGVIQLANIGNLNINTINFDYTNGIPRYIGSMAYRTDNANFYNINISNIGDLLAAGENAIGVGGFAGYITSSNFNNISIKNIKSIKVDSKAEQLYTAWIGGFGGRVDNYPVGSNDPGGAPNVFKNITISGIGSIYASVGYNYWSNYVSIGSFAGTLYTGNYLENVYIYFDKGYTIGQNGFSSFYFGKLSPIGRPNALKNVHIYHYENDLANATADQSYENDFNQNGYIQNKINIHTYTDETQESVYKDFLSKADTIEKPTTPDNPNKPSDSDVILASDDVISANDLNKWLGEILSGKYWIDIKDFKIQGLSEELKQSISFLEALYGQKGMKEILEGISQEYKNTYVKFNQFAINKANLLAFINDKLKPLVDSSNNALAQLKTIQEQLKIAITKYNDYVKKINENPSIKNEATLASLKAEVDRLSNLSGELATTIANNQIKLETWQKQASDKSNQQFNIIGKFDNIALTIPNLEKLNNSSGIENDDYQKLSRQIASSQKQTPTFKYEEEETQEIDEAALTQRARTCIVSDNFKTMNPCVVGSY